MFNQEVQARIEGYADTVGHKAANLKELTELSKKLNMELGFNIQVPNILPLTHDNILTHLSHYAPEWQTLWEAFKDKQKDDASGLNKEASLKLDELRGLILKTFTEHPFSIEILGPYLEQIKKTAVMVRSTGAEDSIKVANPGAHESAPAEPDVKAISYAIGIVVASYFSDKALQQRFLTQENAVNDIAEILKDPFMPVLIQRMIGEPLMGHRDPSLVVKSGVMYTSDSGARIQLAPGHGELVVNSQAPFDTFFVTREDVVHAEINRKPIRLVPSVSQTENTKKTTLVRQNNSKELRDEPAISNFVALKIAKAGRLIEEHYGMPMDVEFVYEPDPNHPDEGTLFLVQARPIPKGDLKRVIPSSIPPEQLKEIKAQQNPIIKGSVITPAGSAARVITHSNQLLICDSITDALKIYLNQKPSHIKAIIVRNEAPETSHEAAVFNSKAIPVLHISETDDIEEWIDPKAQKKPVIVIDPQRSQCVNFSAVPNIGSSKNPEEALFDEGILKVGLFKSPLPARETLVPLFPKVSEAVKERVIVSQTSSVNNTEATIGALIEKANSKDEQESERALNELMPLLFKELPTSYPEQRPQQFYTTLLQHIETLEAAKCGDEKVDSLKALQQLLAAFYQLGKSTEGQKTHSPHGKLFRQAMVTGAEIHRSLTGLSNIKADTPESTATQTEFLNLVSKLEALIVNPGNKDLFSDSILQIAQDNAALKEAEKVEGFEKLTEEQKTYFVEFVKFKKIALSEADAAEWVKFAYRCCQNKDNMLLLAQLVTFSMQNKIESDWLNISFDNHLKAVRNRKPKVSGDQEIRAILLSLSQELSQTAKELDEIQIKEKRAILDTWERQIGEWADPKKFDDLSIKFEKEFLPLIDQLSIDASQQPLTQKAILKAVLDLTEIMDRTIKAMKGSPDYDKEKEKQVQRFAKLLEPYHHLMEKWILQAPTDGRINNLNESHILYLIEKQFKKLKNETDPKHLNPSGNLFIAFARIDSIANLSSQIDDHIGLTLEDLFSLLHQNILAKIVFLGQSKQIPLEKLPNAIQALTKALTGIKYRTDSIKPELLYIEHTYPIVQLEFNLPLREHSAKFLLKYNQDTQKTIFEVNFFGGNSRKRMNLICILANLESKILNVRLKQTPFYNKTTCVASFSFEIDKDNIDNVTPILKEALEAYVAITFGVASNTLSGLLSERYSNDEIKKGIQALTQEEIEEMLKEFPWFIDELVDNTLQENPLIHGVSVYDLNPSMVSVGLVTTLMKKFGFKPDYSRKDSDGHSSFLEKLILSQTNLSSELYVFMQDNQIFELLDEHLSQTIIKREDLNVLMLDKLVTDSQFKPDFIQKGSDGISLIEKLILSKKHSSEELLEFIDKHNEHYSIIDLFKDSACTQAVLKRQDLWLFVALNERGANLDPQYVYEFANPSVLMVKKMMTDSGFVPDFTHRGLDGVSFIEKLILSKTHTSQELLDFFVELDIIHLLNDPACTQAVLKKQDLWLLVELSKKGINFNLKNEKTKNELLGIVENLPKDISTIKALLVIYPDIFEELIYSLKNASNFVKDFVSSSSKDDPCILGVSIYDINKPSLQMVQKLISEFNFEPDYTRLSSDGNSFLGKLISSNINSLEELIRFIKDNHIISLLKEAELHQVILRGDLWFLKGLYLNMRSNGIETNIQNEDTKRDLKALINKEFMDVNNFKGIKDLVHMYPEILKEFLLEDLIKTQPEVFNAFKTYLETTKQPILVNFAQTLVPPVITFSTGRTKKDIDDNKPKDTAGPHPS